MKALVFNGKNTINVEEVKKPTIENPKDAILKVTSSAICGSDLHMYDGRTDMPKGSIFGHEIMGVIESVGEAVTSIKVGDRVVLPFNIACGFCFNCIRQFPNACLTVNPEGPGGAYGYADMGPFKGGQAEFVRVPFADYNCVKLPGKPFDEFEIDFLLLADIFPTGYHACELANVQPGKSVAIFGAGPVGLLAAYSAFIKGASQVFIVDQSDVRLQLAKQIGAHPIDLKAGNPAEQILEAIAHNQLIQESLRPGEIKMPGVLCGIDAVGYQARKTEDINDEDPGSVLTQLAKIVNPTGNIGVVGVYMPVDPRGVDSNAKQGIIEIPYGTIFYKGITIALWTNTRKKICRIFKRFNHCQKSKTLFYCFS